MLTSKMVEITQKVLLLFLCVNSYEIIWNTSIPPSLVTLNVTWGLPICLGPQKRFDIIGRKIDRQSCPINLTPLFRAPVLWVVPVWLIYRLMRESRYNIDKGKVTWLLDKLLYRKCSPPWTSITRCVHAT